MSEEKKEECTDGCDMVEVGRTAIEGYERIDFRCTKCGKEVTEIKNIVSHIPKPQAPRIKTPACTTVIATENEDGTFTLRIKPTNEEAIRKEAEKKRREANKKKYPPEYLKYLPR